MVEKPKKSTGGPLVEEELAELEGLLKDATPEPWWYDEGPQFWRLHGTAGWTPEQGSGEFKIPAQPLNLQILKAAKQSDVFMPYWPNGADGPLIPLMRNALPRLIAEVRELRSLVGRCICPPVGDAREEGPQYPDESCPVHGAINVLRAENDDLKRRLELIFQLFRDILQEEGRDVRSP